MEQLEDTIFVFEALAKGGDGNVAPFSLRVAHPVYDEGRGYFCRVECSFLREKPFLIFGVDEEQACELSISFIRQSVTDVDATLIDVDGNEISIPEIDFPREMMTD